MKKKREDRSLREYLQKVLIRYTLIPVAAAIFLVFILVFFFNIASTIYRAEKENVDVASALAAGISPYLNEIDRLSGDSGLISLLEQGGNTQKMYERLYRFTNSQALGCNFYLIGKDGEAKMSSQTILPDYLQPKRPYLYGIFRRMENFPDRPILMLNDSGNVFSPNIVFSIGRAVCRDEGGILGFLIFELNKGDVYDYINTNLISDIVVSDTHNTVLLASRNIFLNSFSKLAASFRTESGIHKIDGSQYYIKAREVTGLELRVYTILQLDDYYRLFIWFGLILFLFLLILIFVMITLANKISASETSSVDEMLSAIRKMQEENLYTDITFEDTGPFSILQASYQQLLDSIRQLVEQNTEAVKRSTRAEIKQLESQFNPHFIFNTLEVIRCLIKLEPQSASRMILDFSELLRYSINSDQKLVRLSQDIHYLKRYLAIAQKRYDNHLHYCFDIDEEAAECPVPKLILQPVIENAVKYGIRCRTDLTVTVSGKVERGELVLSVHDNGSGIEADKLNAILDSLRSDAAPSEHFGLYNVNRRIWLMYGEGYFIQIFSSPGLETTVIVRIPLE